MEGTSSLRLIDLLSTDIIEIKNQEKLKMLDFILFSLIVVLLVLVILPLVIGFFPLLLLIIPIYLIYKLVKASKNRKSD
jgi:hypothetical protein